MTCATVEQGIPLLLTSDQDECHALQSIGTYCGCPVPSNACAGFGGFSNSNSDIGNNYCFDEKDPLAFVTDFPGTDTGLKTPCMIAHSYLQSFAQNSTECVQYQDQWKQTCGCDNENTSTTGGVTTLPDDNNNNNNNKDEEDDSSSSPIVPLEKGCPVCVHGGTMMWPQKDLTQYLDVTGDNYLTSLAWEAAAMAGQENNVTCALADLITRSGIIPPDLVCDSDELAFVAGLCGCPPHPDDPCEICPTHDMTLPERRLGHSKAVYGFNVTCAIAANALTQIKSTNDVCWNLKVDTWQCGCNGGIPWYLGASQKAQHVLLAWIPRVSGLLSLLGSVYIIQDVVRRFRKREPTTYDLILLGMSLFDISSSVAWMFSTAPLPGYDKNTFTESGVYGAVGSETTCRVQGFFVELGFIGSTAFNASLTTFYLFSIVYGYRESRMKSLRKYFLAIPSILAFTLAAAAIPYYRPYFVACLISNPNSDLTSQWVHLIVFSILPVGTAIVISLLNMGAIVRHVWVISRKADRWRFASGRTTTLSNAHASQHQTSAPSNSSGADESVVAAVPENDGKERQRRRRRKIRAEEAVLWQAIWYAIAFLLTWGFYIVGQFKPYFSSNDDGLFAFWVIMLVLNPLMGFWNAFVYAKPWMWKIRPERPSQVSQRNPKGG